MPIRLFTTLLTLALAAPSAVLAQGSAQARPRTSGPGRTPDISGVWLIRSYATTFSSLEPPMTPWAEARFRAARPGYGPRATPDSEDPILSCQPPGVPRIMLLPFPIQIVQIPGQVILLFEYDHFIRHIYLDVREHPKDLDPTWMGHSIGRWEGDTLVVDTVGFHDRTWLDQVGHPHSEALRVVERFRRTDPETLQYDVTIHDSTAYRRPWSGQLIFKLRPGWQLLEYVCVDNMVQSGR